MHRIRKRRTKRESKQTIRILFPILQKKMIRKFYFKDGTEQITYTKEEAEDVLMNEPKEILKMERLDKDENEKECTDCPFI